MLKQKIRLQAVTMLFHKTSRIFEDSLEILTILSSPLSKTCKPLRPSRVSHADGPGLMQQYAVQLNRRCHKHALRRDLY